MSIKYDENTGTDLLDQLTGSRQSRRRPGDNRRTTPVPAAAYRSGPFREIRSHGLVNVNGSSRIEHFVSDDLNFPN